jgi:hypothetical protein
VDVFFPPDPAQRHQRGIGWLVRSTFLLHQPLKSFLLPHASENCITDVPGGLGLEGSLVFVNSLGCPQSIPRLLSLMQIERA